MQIVKFVRESIFEITADELEGLIEKRDLGINYTCEEKQLFIHELDGGFTAIDNRTGELFMEDFKIEDDAYIWLLDLKCSEVLQKAEEQDYWW